MSVLQSDGEMLYPDLSREDFLQIRLDTQRLRAENALLKERLENLQRQVVTNTWAGLELH